MNEEVIKQCARDGYAELCRKEGWSSLADAATRGEEDDADEVVCAIAAIRLCDARAVAPLEQLAAENLKLANDAAAVLRESEQDRERLKQELAALRSNVAPLVEAADGLMSTLDGVGTGDVARAINSLREALAPFQQDGNAPTMAQAAADVLAERRRQIEAEGWTPEHDDKNESGDMARAAACYALVAADYPADDVAILRFWPWLDGWWKPSDQRRNLVKAGALILAEIERIDRAAAKEARDAAD